MNKPFLACMVIVAGMEYAVYRQILEWDVTGDVPPTAIVVGVLLLAAWGICIWALATSYLGRS